MKLNFSQALAASALSLMLVFSSCSKSKNADVASIASADDIAVATFNLEEIAKNAGCTVADNQISLPEKYKKAAAENIQAIKWLSVKGVELKSVLMCASKESQVAALTLTDPAAFQQWLIDLNGSQPADNNGYAIYDIDKNTWLVKDNAAYCLFDVKPAKAVDVLESRFEAAKKAPIGASQAEKLAKDKTANIILNAGKMMEFAAETSGSQASNNDAIIAAMGYDADAIKGSYSYVEIELEGKEAECEVNLYTKDGKDIVSSIKFPKIDTSVARYCASNPIYNILFTIPGDLDWNSVIDAAISLVGGYAKLGVPRQYFAIAANVLQDIEGTVAISLSSNLLEALSANDPSKASPAETGVALVVQTKSGKAAEYVGQLKALATTFLGTAPNSTADGFEIMIPQSPMPINVAAIGNNFIIALGQINTRGSLVGSSSIYSGECTAIAFDLPKGSEIAKSADIDYSISGYMKSDSKESEGKLVVSDTDMPLLETIITYALPK